MAATKPARVTEAHRARPFPCGRLPVRPARGGQAIGIPCSSSPGALWSGPGRPYQKRVRCFGGDRNPLWKGQAYSLGFGIRGTWIGGLSQNWINADDIACAEIPIISSRCSSRTLLLFERILLEHPEPSKRDVYLAALATVLRSAAEPGLLTECFTRISTGDVGLP